MRIEQLILENLIYDSQYASLVGVFLKPEYFRAHPEKIVFREIQNHIKEYNKAPSVSSLANIISERDDLNENLFKNCLEILKAYKKKSDDTEWLIHETEKWAKDAAVYNGIVDSIAILEGKDTKKPKDAIPDMLTDALAVSLDTSVGHNYIDDASERWDYYHKREQRYPFGIEMLDKITGGGISPKTLTVFLGGTGSGKTLVKTHLASQYIKQGFDVLYITMEMAQERIAERVDANLLDIDLDQIRLLPRDSFNAKIEKMMNSYVYIKSIAEEIRGFAVECNVPVITSSQLNREGFMSSDPDLSNISESFGLPATADLMLAIVAKEDNGGQLMFKQLKNRYSDPTINSKFMLGMNKNRMRLESISQSQQPVLANGGGDTKKTPDSPFLKQHKDVKTATSDWKI
jgi:replicative DNA helicase